MDKILLLTFIGKLKYLFYKYQDITLIVNSFDPYEFEKKTKRKISPLSISTCKLCSGLNCIKKMKSDPK